MNMHRPISPAAKAIWQTHSARLDALIAATGRYRTLLDSDATSARHSTKEAWLSLCEAACDLWDDGDARAARDDAYHELGLADDELERAAGMDERLPHTFFASVRGAA